MNNIQATKKQPLTGRAADNKRPKLEYSEERFMPYMQLKNYWVMNLLQRDDPNNPTAAFIQCSNCKNIIIKSKHLVGTCEAKLEVESSPKNGMIEEQKGSPLNEKSPA